MLFEFVESDLEFAEQVGNEYRKFLKVDLWRFKAPRKEYLVMMMMVTSVGGASVFKVPAFTPGNGGDTGRRRSAGSVRKSAEKISIKEKANEW
jgi:hypothetical protein